MGRYWWTVWIKVAVLALALFIVYCFASNYVQELFEPYLLEESKAEEADSEDSDLVAKLVGKVESFFDIHIDYENMIFDYANEYAKEMMKQSAEERSATEMP